ncbi:MAG: hypothetical protein Q9208_006321 [Pyrenodesmia sp. 3 TL-2023]
MWRYFAIAVAAYASLAATQTITPRTGWTVTVDSSQSGTGNEATKMLDGNTTTYWHTQYMPTTAALPHVVTIDMKTTVNVNGLTYLPRQVGSLNGNIGQHTVQLSSDGTTFNTVAFGTYLDDRSLKTTPFTTTPARYVRLTAQTEAGGRGPWTSAAEINILSAATYTKPATSGGIWGATIDFPIVPAAAAVLDGSGKVLMWSSYKPFDFAHRKQYSE